MSFNFNNTSSLGAIVLNKNVIGAAYNGNTKTQLNVASYSNISNIIPTSGAVWMFEMGQYTSGSGVLTNLVGTLSSSMYWTGSTGVTGIPGNNSSFAYTSSFRNGQVNNYLTANGQPNFTSFRASGSATSLPVSSSLTMMVWIRQNFLGYAEGGAYRNGTYLQIGNNDVYTTAVSIGETFTGEATLGIGTLGSAATYNWVFCIDNAGFTSAGIGNVIAFRTGDASGSPKIQQLAQTGSQFFNNTNGAKWMLLTGVLSGSNTSIYLNDVLLATGGAIFPGSTGSLQIGNNASNWQGPSDKTNAYPIIPSGANYATASLDMGFGAVYNRALSVDEIRSVYQTLQSKYINFPIVNATAYKNASL